MKEVVESAPQLMNFLGEASLAHFNALRQILDANGVQYSLNPRLVRGMDYYNLTVFEFITDQLGSQGTVCGGGRYDYLIEQVGGKPAPAVGWALGLERVLALLEEQGETPQAASRLGCQCSNARRLRRGRWQHENSIQKSRQQWRGLCPHFWYR
jgi:histidyl-tRNA synthetase